MAGAAAVKSFIAILIAVFIAQVLGLHGYAFAGIMAAIAVHFSRNLSFLRSLRMAASGAAGALLGAIAFCAGGSNFLSIGLAALVMIAFHAWVQWTESVLISVAAAMIAIGTASLSGFWESAGHSVALALIGAGAGLLVNLAHRPIRQKGPEATEGQAERMLRALIHFIILDLETKRITRPPIVDEQVKEIGGYLRKGMEQRERDRKSRILQGPRHADVFHVLEGMLGRIGEIVRVLVQNPLEEEGYLFTIKTLKLITRLQEKIARGDMLNLALLKSLLERKRSQLRPETADAEGMHQLCTLFLDYLDELEKLQLELSNNKP